MRTKGTTAAKPPAEKPPTEAEQEGRDPRSIEALADRMKLKPGALGTGIRDTMIETFKHRQTDWGKMSEEGQKDLARQFQYQADSMVRAVIHELASMDRPAVLCKLTGVSIKDGVKITLDVGTMPHDELLAAISILAANAGKEVMLVTADGNGLFGNEPPPTEPDQVSMGFEADQNRDQMDNDDLAGEEGDKPRERFGVYDEALDHWMANPEGGFTDDIIQAARFEQHVAEELAEKHGGIVKEFTNPA